MLSNILLCCQKCLCDACNCCSACDHCGSCMPGYLLTTFLVLTSLYFVVGILCDLVWLFTPASDDSE